MSKQMKKIRKVLAILLSVAMLASVLLSGNVFVNAAADNTLPEGISVTDGYGDTVELSTEFANEGNSLKLNAHGTADSHLAGFVLEGDRGDFNGKGVSFWLKGPDTNTWGAVAMRSTDSSGNVKWFKTVGQYDNPAYIMDQGDGSAFVKSIDYSSLYATSDWRTGKPNGSEATPTDNDIANFDAIIISIYMWGGWTNKTAYLDNVTVLGKKEATFAENVVLADFEGNTQLPANVSLGVPDFDIGEVVTGVLGDGNALKVTGKGLGQRNVPVLISAEQGDLYGDGISFTMKGEYSEGWGTFAMHATYPDGSTKWFKLKYWDSHFGNPAAPYFYSDANPTVAFKYADLCETNDWIGGLGTGATPTEYDIANFDMIGIGCYMWADWSDTAFYLDDITVLNHTSAPEIDDNIIDFDDMSALPANISSSLPEFNPIELSNEFAQSGNSLKLSTIGLGASYLTGIVIEGQKGDFNKGGISFWLKGPDVGAWGAVAVRTVDADGNVKWFKNSSHFGNPATIFNADSSTDTVNVNMDYSVLCECANNDWVWDAPDWNTAAKMTADDIANIDAVAIGVFIWGDWGAKTTYIDSISYKAPSFKTDSDVVGVDTIVYDFGETIVAGDADGNGEVDIRDLVRIKKYLAKISGEIKLEAADIDGVDGVDTKDLVAVRKMLLA